MGKMRKDVREALQDEPRMQKCEICAKSPVQWHHVFNYAGKQIQDGFNIAAACLNCHKKATPHSDGRKYNRDIREQFEWYALQRMTSEDIAKYWKKDWGLYVHYLSKKAKEYDW